MKMLMLVFRSSLKERIYDMLDKCAIRAFSEVTDTVGCGVTGSAEGSVFNPSTNSILLVALDDALEDRLLSAVKKWCEETEHHPNWQKPSIRVFVWQCLQAV